MDLVAVPDIIFLDLCTVPQIKTRVNAMLISYDWIRLTNGIDSKIEKLLNGIDLQLADENLKIMLEYALAAGNYLNGTSSRGGAYAFKLDIMS